MSRLAHARAIERGWADFYALAVGWKPASIHDIEIGADMYGDTHQEQLDRSNDNARINADRDERARVAGSVAHPPYEEREGRHEIGSVFAIHECRTEVYHYGPGTIGLRLTGEHVSVHCNHIDSGLSLQTKGGATVHLTRDVLREIHRQAGEVLAEIDRENGGAPHG